MSKHGYGGLGLQHQLEALKTCCADQAELLGILSQENRQIARIAHHLSDENKDLRRLCELQQRRIDGFEAEAWSLREVS